MRPDTAALLAALPILLAGCGHAQAPPAVPATIPVLILDGQNNHDWRRTTASLRGDAAGHRPLHRHRLHHARTRAARPRPGTPGARTSPPTEVVVSNYNGEDWPEPVRRGFVAFVGAAAAR